MARASRKKEVAASAADPDHVCAGYSLQFFQNWTVPGTTIFRTDTIILEVLDGDGNRFVVGSETASDEEDLIQSLFERIAKKKGETGWTFKGSNGVITG